jgi:hypothetical protein
MTDKPLNSYYNEKKVAMAWSIHPALLALLCGSPWLLRTWAN